MHGFCFFSRQRVPALLCAVSLLAVSAGASAQSVNRPPTISGSPPASMPVGGEYSFFPTASDPERATLRFSIVNKPSWLNFSTQTGRILGWPSSVGSWSNIQILVTDGTHTVAMPPFSIQATPKSGSGSGSGSGSVANRAPVISGSPATSATAGSAYSFQPAASDADGNALTFSVTNTPSWATFSSSTGRLRGTPTAAQAGTYSGIAIRVSDGRASASLPSFSITVSTAANRAPTISGTPATAVTAGQGYSFRPAASDADNNPLGFSIQNRPSWATFSTSTGTLSGTPAAANVGTYSGIVISASDGTATVALPAFTIAVNAPANGTPVISGAPVTSINAGSAYSFRPTASDPNGDALTFAIANRPSWATFNTGTGQLTGSPTAANVGSYSNVVISVSDGRASASLPAFAVSVVDVSVGGATLSWSPPTQNTDGSTLANLSGYRIYYGASADELTHTVQVANAGVTTYVVENLAPGTYYFMVRAYSNSGNESGNSNLASKVVR